MPQDAVLISPHDNVAVALHPLTAGEKIVLPLKDAPLELILQEPIPFCHKFAVQTITAGDPVIKYGETIGRATRDIRPGEHVHLSNCEGTRGRGDRR